MKVIEQIEEEKAVQLLIEQSDSIQEQCSEKEIAGNDQSPGEEPLEIEEEKKDPAVVNLGAGNRLPLDDGVGQTNVISSCEMTPTENMLRQKRQRAFKLDQQNANAR